jgi:Glycosyltransferase 61
MAGNFMRGVKARLKRVARRTLMFGGRELTPRVLFFEDQAAWPSTVEVVESIAPRAEISRVTPDPYEVFPNHIAGWAQGMYPFADEVYRTHPLRLWKGSEVRTLGRRGGLVFSDGTFDRSTFQWVGPDLRAPILDWNGGNLVVPNSAEREISEPSFLAFNSGHTNYAHWLTDNLVYLYLYVTKLKPEGIKIVLPDSLLGFARETVELLGITSEDTIVAGDEILNFNELYFSDTIYFGEIPAILRDAADYLKQRAFELDVPGSADRLVYISRPDATARPLMNNEELEAKLSSIGFDIVATGTLTLRDQIKLFAETRVVVGQHGAGLMNSIFCQPGALLIELFPEYMLQGHFWNAASLMGLRYGFLSGTSFDADSSTVTVDGNWEAASVIDVDRVAEICTRNARGSIQDA